MKSWIYVALAAAAPAFAQPTLPTKEAPPKKEAAKAKPAAKGGALATVNGVAVPQARADALMQQQQGRLPDNEQTRAMVREELINREVLAQEAQRSGIAKSPEIQAQMDMARQEVLVNAYIRDWVRKNPISDGDVAKEYERVKSQAGDREYKARHILVESEDEAKGLIAELKKGGKFEDLASKRSKDSGTAQHGGELDWSVPANFDIGFSEAMVRLEKGKYTEAPVRSRYGWHVIRLDDVREVKFPALNDVRQRLAQQVTQQRIEQMVKQLRAKAKVQ